METELKAKLRTVQSERDKLAVTERELRLDLETKTREHKVWSQLQHELEHLREQNRQLKGGASLGEETVLAMLHTDD